MLDKFLTSKKTIKVFTLLLFLLSTLTVSAETVTSEYKIKAALLYKLTRFVEWPNISKLEIYRRFTICVLGRNDFGQALEALTNRKVKGLPITVEYFNQSNDIQNSCQLVFISDSKSTFVKSITQSIVQYPILTVGDSEGFAIEGGMIQLTYIKKKISFKINLKQVKRAGLNISAPLLELSTIVDD